VKAGWIRAARHPSCPGSTVLSPKIAGMERREATRFRSPSCRKRCRKRTKTFAPRGAPCPSCFDRGTIETTPRAMRENGCACANGSGCLKTESGTPKERLLHLARLAGSGRRPSAAWFRGEGQARVQGRCPSPARFARELSPSERGEVKKSFATPTMSPPRKRRPITTAHHDVGEKITPACPSNR